MPPTPSSPPITPPPPPPVQPPGDVIIDNHLVHACAPGDEEVEDLGGDDVVLDLLPIPRELDGDVL